MFYLLLLARYRGEVLSQVLNLLIKAANFSALQISKEEYAMPEIMCPQCEEKLSANDLQCTQCGFELNSQKDDESHNLDEQDDLFIVSDILSFPFLPFRSNLFHDDEYREMGARGSTQNIIALVIFNNFAVIMSIYMLVGNNPYIDIGIDPFTFTCLGFGFFLLIAFFRFLSFRAVSGEGNFVDQGYLDAIVTTDYLLLYGLSIILLLLTRSEDLSNFIIVAGGLYLVIP